MNKEIRKTKMFNYIAFGIVIALALVIAGTVIEFINRPLDSYVTVEGIQMGTQTHENYVLAKSGDSYYETDPSDEFAALFQFEEWEMISVPPEGEPLLSLQFAELWVVDIYSDGRVAAYNGYAPSTRCKDSACYSMPTEAVAQVIEYLEKNAIEHEMGDGTITRATFNHE